MNCGLTDSISLIKSKGSFPWIMFLNEQLQRLNFNIYLDTNVQIIVLRNLRRICYKWGLYYRLDILITYIHSIFTLFTEG